MINVKSTKTWLKWAGAAIGAAVMALLAFLYGKKTLGVLKAELGANKAKEVVLQQSIQKLRAEAEVEPLESKKHLKIVKANTLQEQRKELGRKREELVGVTTGDLKLDDIALARARNRSHSAA